MSATDTASADRRPLAHTFEFERMCSFVAIRQTQSGDEVLRELLVHNCSTGTSQSLRTASAFVDEIQHKFGLTLKTGRVQSALDSAVSRDDLRRTPEGAYVVSPQKRQDIEERLERARTLELRVRDRWLASISATHPDLDSDELWAALQAYLSSAFKQHGVQVMMLLDPSIVVPSELQVSLRSALIGQLRARFPESQRKAAERSIEAFLLSAGANSDTAAYMAQAADCAVSYYSLTVPPDVAQRLRGKLKPLTLFLDTNVLFGLVGLDDGPLVEVSHELVDVVACHDVPFRLRYHMETERELRTTLDASASRLKGTIWAPHISRAAAKLDGIATIQRLYHERNAERPITAESFFRRFEHIDVLLQEKGILPYRGANADRQRVLDWINDFEAFLKRGGRRKPYEAYEHDMTLLDCTHRLRSKAPSSLDAEALVVTYDGALYRFDWENSRAARRPGCTILPNHLLQLLRPFMASTADLDRSFAAAFAVPEFRVMGSKSQIAVAKMLQILASYEDLSEDTATAVIANDLVLSGVTRAHDDDEIRAYVDSAVAAENAVLAQQNRELEDALVKREEELRREWEQRALVQREEAEEMNRRLQETQAAEQRQAEGAREARERHARERQLVEQQAADAHAAMEAERAARTRGERELAGLATRLEQNTRLLEATDHELQARTQLASELQRRNDRRARVEMALGLIAISALVVAMELGLRLTGWQWLTDHRNSVGIRVTTYVTVAALFIGATQPRSRNIAWWVMGAGGFFTLMQLLGN